MSPGVFLGIGLALFVVPLIAESITSWIVIRGARKNHPRLWEHSGRPTLMGNGNLSQAWPLVRYYRDRGWLARQRPHRDAPRKEGQRWIEPITDPKDVAFAEKMRLPLVWSYWAAWLGVAACPLFLVSGGLFFF